MSLRRLPGHFCLEPTNSHCNSVNRLLIPEEAAVLVMRMRTRFFLTPKYHLKPKICNNSITCWMNIKTDLGLNCRLRRKLVGRRPRLQMTNECTLLPLPQLNKQQAVGISKFQNAFLENKAISSSIISNISLTQKRPMNLFKCLQILDEKNLPDISIHSLHATSITKEQLRLSLPLHTQSLLTALKYLYISLF